jgi:glucose/arabinose dehydrogenase
MRAVFASLIIAAGLAPAAQAQQAQPQAPVTPAPAASTPMPAQPAPGGPAPTTSAPLAPAAPAAAAPQAPPAAAEPPPTIPTSGDGAVVISLLEKVCTPIVRGQSLDTVAKSAGLKQNRRDGTWSMPLSGDRNYQIIVQPQFSNKNVCQAEVHFAVGQDHAIVSALNIWSFLHKPQLAMTANYVNVDADGVKRVRRSWDHTDPSSTVGLNFSTMRKPDDSPLDPHFDTGMLFYQERAGA